VLEKVCEYFYYNEKHKNSKDVPDIDVPAELCLELLMAADYLNGEFPRPYPMSSMWTLSATRDKVFLYRVFSVKWRADLFLQFDRGYDIKS
jgi:hypothetical protein